MGLGALSCVFNQLKHSMWFDLDQWEWTTLVCLCTVVATSSRFWDHLGPVLLRPSSGDNNNTTNSTSSTECPVVTSGVSVLDMPIWSWSAIKLYFQKKVSKSLSERAGEKTQNSNPLMKIKNPFYCPEFLHNNDHLKITNPDLYGCLRNGRDWETSGEKNCWLRQDRQGSRHLLHNSVLRSPANFQLCFILFPGPLCYRWDEWSKIFSH